MTVVIGTRGGVGASTVAANVGWLLADKSKEKIGKTCEDCHNVYEPAG